METPRYGLLAVPRNSFLQPEAVVELLDDHREEVRLRVEERRRETEDLERVQEDLRSAPGDAPPPGDFVRHLKATFDPAACPTCIVFGLCRQELRDSADPTDLLIEIGIDPAGRTCWAWSTPRPRGNAQRVRAGAGPGHG